MNFLRNTSGMRDKRILFYNHTSLVSGAEISLLEMLSEIKDNEFILACPPGKIVEFAEKRKIKWISAPALDIGLKKNPFYILVFLAHLLRASLWLLIFSRRWKADLIYANTIRGGLATILSFLCGIRTVVHIRDILPHNSLISKIITYFLTNFSGHLIFNSEFTREKFGIRDEKKTSIIYSPVGYRFFRFIDSKFAKKALGIENRYPIISVIGQIAPWKRLEMTINAVKSIRNKYPDVLLLIVGEVVFRGKKRRLPNELYYESLKEMVSEEDLSENVMFLGRRDDVEMVINASDLVLLTSLNEPFGRVIGEAMACVVPVLVPEESGIGRIIKEKNCGWLFSEGDDLSKKIISVLHDEASKEKVIRGLFLSYELFSPDEISDRIKKILNEEL